MQPANITKLSFKTAFVFISVDLKNNETGMCTEKHSRKTMTDGKFVTSGCLLLQWVRRLHHRLDMFLTASQVMLRLIVDVSFTSNPKLFFFFRVNTLVVYSVQLQSKSRYTVSLTKATCLTLGESYRHVYSKLRLLAP